MSLKLVRCLLSVLVWLVVLGDLLGETAFACPMCKAALEEDDLKPMAYQASILFMLSVPMTIFAGIAVLLFFINRRESKELEHAALQY